MSQIVSRLETYIVSKKMSVRKFETAIGASNGSISRAIKNKTDIYANWISIIVDTFPDINPIWLLTGEGEMVQEVTQGGDPSVKKEVESTFYEKNVHTEIQQSITDADKLTTIVKDLQEEKGHNPDKSAMSAENYLQLLLSKFDNIDTAMTQLRSDFTTLERKVTGE